MTDAGFFLEQAVEIVERGMIERALARTNGNQLRASKMLGIHRNTLQRKMVEYKIDGKRPRRKPAATAQARRAQTKTTTRRRTA
jgi:DNA-binding NtrC family response regulator